MKKAFKYRIYPNKKQEARLETSLDQACFLYNQLLDIKQQIYLGEGENLSEYDMNNLVKDFDTNALHSQVKINISKRISDAFKHFFRRVKNGEIPGFPKFKKRIFYESITFPQYRNKIKSNKLAVSRIGNIEILYHREIEGKIKTLTIKKENDEWYAIFSCMECPTEEQKTEPISEVEGLDVGIKKYLVCSDGQEQENPQWLRKSENRIKLFQRRLNRKKKGSKNRRKAKKKLEVKQTKVRRQREDFHKKLARRLAMEIKYIGVENLNIKGMVRNHHLAKSISDCGWGSFFTYLKYYKTIFNGEIIEIGRFEPTSQTCSNCGYKQKILLNKRIFRCEDCGLKIDRDLNASINIKKLTIKKLIEKGVKFNTIGQMEIYACGDTVRPSLRARVGEAGTIRDEVVICNQ